VSIRYSATHSVIYHGRNGIYDQVEDVVVVDIGSGSSHVLDCTAPGGGSVDNLRWERDEGNLTFPVSTVTRKINGVSVMVKRLTLGVDPPFSGLGIYACININERAPINITGGKCVSYGGRWLEIIHAFHACTISKLHQLMAPEECKNCPPKVI
jgi:hypothetical protein